MSASAVVAKKISREAATAAAAGSVLLWCWSGTCFAAGSDTFGPMVYLTFMSAAGSLTVVILHVLARKPIADLYRIPVRVMVSGFFGVAVYTVMLCLAFGIAPKVDIGQVNLLNYLWPIWMVLLSIVLLRERPNVRLTVIGSLLGFAGVALARGIDGLTRMPQSLLPHAMALGGGFMWALYSVLLRRWNVPEEKGGTPFHFAACAVLAAAIAGAGGQWQNLPRFGWAGVFWIVFGGIGPVGLGYHWWELGVKRGSVQFISQLAYFIPIGSSILLALFFRESLNAGLIPGACLIAIGARVVKRGASR